MSLMLYALWKAPVLQRVDVKESPRRCTTCGVRKATIKLRLPHVRLNGTLYQYKWICDKCYETWYPKSKKKFPDEIEIPNSRKAWQIRRTEIVKKLFPRKVKGVREMGDQEEDIQ